MGLRGPTRKADAIRRQDGRRAPKAAAVRPGRPLMPAWIAGRPEAAAVWAALLREVPVGHLARGDARALELVVRLTLEVDADQRRCLEDGRDLETRDTLGQVRVTSAPWALRLSKNLALLRSALVELGLTPRSRTNVSPAPAAVDDARERRLARFFSPPPRPGA